MTKLVSSDDLNDELTGNPVTISTHGCSLIATASFLETISTDACCGQFFDCTVARRNLETVCAVFRCISRVKYWRLWRKIRLENQRKGPGVMPGPSVFKGSVYFGISPVMPST